MCQCVDHYRKRETLMAVDARWQAYLLVDRCAKFPWTSLRFLPSVRISHLAVGKRSKYRGHRCSLLKAVPSLKVRLKASILVQVAFEIQSSLSTGRVFKATPPRVPYVRYILPCNNWQWADDRCCLTDFPAWPESSQWLGLGDWK